MEGKEEVSVFEVILLPEGRLFTHKQTDPKYDLKLCQSHKTCQ